MSVGLDKRFRKEVSCWEGRGFVVFEREGFLGKGRFSIVVYRSRGFGGFFWSRWFYRDRSVGVGTFVFYRERSCCFRVGVFFFRALR